MSISFCIVLVLLYLTAAVGLDCVIRNELSDLLEE